MNYPIKPFKFWCQTVLPTVFDDSLSYYELLNKVVAHLNEVTTVVNSTSENVEKLAESFNELKEYVDTHLDKAVEEAIDKYIVEKGLVASVNGLTGKVILTATDVGAIPANIGSVIGEYIANGSITLSKFGNFGEENSGKRLVVLSDGTIGLARGEGTSGVDSVNGMTGAVILTYLPNPHAISFTNGNNITKEYDGRDAVSVALEDLNGIANPSSKTTHDVLTFLDGKWAAAKITNNSVLNKGISIEKLHVGESVAKSGDILAVTDVAGLNRGVVAVTPTARYNALINADFRNGAINQRGESTYTTTLAKYTLDEWRITNSTIKVETDHLEVSLGAGASTRSRITNHIHRPLTPGTYTLSALVKAKQFTGGEVNLLLTDNYAIVPNTGIAINTVSDEYILFTRTFTVTTTIAKPSVEFLASATNVAINFDVAVVMLELGNSCTLNGLAPQDKTIEKIKCLANLTRFNATKAEWFSDANATTTTTAVIGVELPVAMEAIKNFDYGGSISLRSGTTSKAITNITVQDIMLNKVSLVLTSSGLTVGENYILRMETGAFLEFSNEE